MPQIRLSFIDQAETISFVAPAHILKMAVAGCARGALTARGLVAAIGQYDPAFSARIASALSEEAAGRGDADLRLAVLAPGDVPGPSLEPEEGGIVIFNLPARRIVQIGSRPDAVERSGRGRMRRNGRPVQVYYAYELPEEWSIVP